MPSIDIGIDLGTANVIIALGNKGIVLNEPSVVAFNKRTNEVVAVGTEAYQMLGRTPEYIVAVKPLTDGVISDHEMTESMIGTLIEKVSAKQLFMPRIIICVPSGITEVESRAVVDAAKNAGVSLYCGEFGVIDRAPAEDTLRWFQDVDTVFKKYNIEARAEKMPSIAMFLEVKKFFIIAYSYLIYLLKYYIYIAK